MIFLEHIDIMTYGRVPCGKNGKDSISRRWMAASFPPCAISLSWQCAKYRQREGRKEGREGLLPLR